MDCGSINSSKYFTLLGIRFFNGELSEAIKLIKRGGLLTAPSGPGWPKTFQIVLNTKER